MNISDLTHRLITLSTGAKGLRTQLPVQVSVPADTSAPVIDIRVSDETLDRYGEIITASVGFIPIRWENGTDKTAWSRKYLEQELLEVSAVGIPANPNALMLALKAGAVDADDLEQLRDLLRKVAVDVAK